MAVRLTVVISQVRQGSSKQQALEASLIAELIGRPGIDVSLIGSLSQVEQSATDRLVLEGISGDFAIVARQPPEKVMEQLAALQISGRRSAHRADPQADADSGRRIYCFDWGRFSEAEELAESLAQLLDERRVVTVSLAPPASTVASGSHSQRDALPIAAGPSRATSSDQQPMAKVRATSSASETDGTDAEPVLPTPDESGEERERAANAHLDALVDDLNSLDL